MWSAIRTARRGSSPPWPTSSTRSDGALSARTRNVRRWRAGHFVYFRKAGLEAPRLQQRRVAGGDQRPAAGRRQRAQGRVALLDLVAVDGAARGRVLREGEDAVEDAGARVEPAGPRVVARWEVRRPVGLADRLDRAGQFGAPLGDVELREGAGGRDQLGGELGLRLGRARLVGARALL